MKELATRLAALAPDQDQYAVDFVDCLLHQAIASRWSDIHLQPTAQGLDVRVRRDGLLHRLGLFPRGRHSDVVARLKVLADLLTYQQETPQEGRIRDTSRFELEMRVSTFPTLFGERAAVRLFGGESSHHQLSQLGMPDSIRASLESILDETHGAILITGPAGSGKTTTAYACLRHIVQATQGGRSVMTLEDPIECALDGVCQSQIKPHVGLDMATGLRSLLRQDPEVLLVGELRDAEVATITMQAALTGQLVVCTFHADNATTAVARLLDMQVEPFCIRSGLLAVLSQRLLRKLCTCRQPIDPADWGLSLPTLFAPSRCPDCDHSGYRGRILVSELLTLTSSELCADILEKRDASTLQRRFEESGASTLRHAAEQAAMTGLTSPQEIRRIFGARSGNGKTIC